MIQNKHESFHKQFIIVGAGTAGLIAALMLREKYPDYQIRILKSDKIGIIGVGEGSTEHWRDFMTFVDIPFAEMIYKTNATVKIGILFKDWIPGKKYVHSLTGLEGNISSLDRPEVLNHLLALGKNEYPVAPLFDAIFSRNRVPFPVDTISNQFHFDTFKLNEYLSSICIARNIEIVEAEVTEIEPDKETGNIHRVITTRGAMEADFFIDCTGFKRIFADILGNPWESKVDYLPMNRAIAFPTEFNDPEEIEPYTLSTALSAGWSWRIPTQTRYGNGYVFNNNYITVEQAVQEISTSLGNKEITPSRDIPFEAGKVNKFWKRNVLHLGLSGSFAEPLEAQSIGFTIVQMFAFLKYFDLFKFSNKARDNYNDNMDKSFQNIVDYLQAHYLTSREDSAFWKEKPFKLTDFNKEYYKAFTEGELLPIMFEKYDMFKTANWYQVLAGIGVIDRFKVINNFSRNRDTYNEKNRESAIKGANEFFERKFIPHKTYLDTVNKNYLNRVYYESF